MALPGLYVQISQYTSKNLLDYATGDTVANTTFICPLNEKFGFGCTQKWFTPLKEFYDFIKTTIEGASVETLKTFELGGFASVASSSFKITETISRIFGFQLFSKGFQAKAWEGSEPIKFPLKMGFYFGMDDKFDGNSEVYSKVLNLMGKTVPKGTNSGTLFSPGPTGVDVFKDYSSTIISGIFKDIGLNKKVNDTENSQSNKSLWTINIGYSKSGSTINKSIFILKNMLIQSSSFSLSPEVDDKGYPINGEVNLEFTSQSIIVESDFTDNVPKPLDAITGAYK